MYTYTYIYIYIYICIYTYYHYYYYHTIINTIISRQISAGTILAGRLGVAFGGKGISYHHFTIPSTYSLSDLCVYIYIYIYIYIYVYT